MKTVTYQVDGPIARITLNRPGRANAITLTMPAEIAACVERANLDQAILTFSSWALAKEGITSATERTITSSLSHFILPSLLGLMSLRNPGSAGG